MGTLLSTLVDMSLLVTNKEHMDMIRTKKIDMRVATVQRLDHGRAYLSDGSIEKVDVIVAATGWELGLDKMMDSGSVLKDLDVEEDGFWLYRNVISPKIKGLYFVGSNSLTLMNIYTSYIQAYWLAGFVAKERPWPSSQYMLKDIEKVKQFKRKVYASHALRSATIECYTQQYHDALFREMKARPPCKCWLVRPLADWILPNTPSRMKNCLEPTKETKLWLLEQKRKRKEERLASSRMPNIGRRVPVTVTPRWLGPGQV